MAANTEITKMLKSADKVFFLNAMIKMFQRTRKKRKSRKPQQGNWNSSEVEDVKKNQKEILKLKNTIGKI